MNNFSLEQIQAAIAQKELMEQAKPKEPGIKNPGAFISAAQGFNAPFERVTYGLQKKIPGAYGTGASQAYAGQLRNLEEAESTHPLATAIGNVLGEATRDAPAFGVGMRAAESLLGRLAPSLIKSLAPGQKSGIFHNLPKYTLGGGLGGGLAAIPDALVSEDTSDISQGAGMGAAGGALIPPALRVTGRALGAVKDISKQGVKMGLDAYTYPHLSEEQKAIKAAKELIYPLNTGEALNAAKVAKAAKERGIILTPAEASGSATLAQREGRLAKTTEQKKKLEDFKKGQRKAQEAAIKKFENMISPRGVGSAEEKFVKEARASIDRLVKDRQTKAEPFYRKSDKVELPEKTVSRLFQDENIKSAAKELIGTPAYREQTKNINPFSIKYLDELQKILSKRARTVATYGEGSDLHHADLINNSRKKLSKELKKASPDYKKATGIYSEDSPAIDRIKQSELGKIASLEDKDAKSVLGELFNQGQRNPKRIAQIRDDFIAGKPENIKLWDDVVKKYLQKSQDTQLAAKTGNVGSEFSSRVASTQNAMDQMEAALSHNPEAVKELKTLKKIFKNLLNARTVKGDYGKAETGMLQIRNTLDRVIGWFENTFQKEKQDKMLELLQSGEWVKAFKTYEKTGSLEGFFDQVSKATGKSIDITKEGYDILKKNIPTAKEFEKAYPEKMTIVIPYTASGKKDNQQ